MELHDLPGDHRAVIVRLTCHKLQGIGPVNESFRADFAIHMYWFEPCLVESSRSMEHEIEQVELSRVQVPVYFFENSNSLEVVIQPVLEIRKKFPLGVVHYEWRVRGEFSEIFELHLFPYDVQTLSVRLRINSQADKARGRYLAYTSAQDPLVDDAVVAYKKESLQLTEWFIYEAATDLTPDSKGKPQFRVHFVLRRQHVYFTWNVIAMNGLTCSLTFATFGVPPEQLSDRASIVLTLLLTTVALRFVSADSLPKVRTNAVAPTRVRSRHRTNGGDVACACVRQIPYFTALDIYMLCGFVLLWAIMIENIAVGYLITGRSGYSMNEARERLIEDGDKAFAWAILGAWILLHIFLTFLVRRYIKRVTRLLGEPIHEKKPNASRLVDAQTVKLTSALRYY